MCHRHPRLTSFPLKLPPTQEQQGLLSLWESFCCPVWPEALQRGYKNQAGKPQTGLALECGHCTVKKRKFSLVFCRHQTGMGPELRAEGRCLT